MWHALSRWGGIAFLCVGTVAWAAPEADEPPADVAAEEQPAGNPYLAPDGLPADKLAKYLERMLAKPKTLQDREPFQRAVADAANRLIELAPDADQKVTAIKAKFHALRRLQMMNAEGVGKQLVDLASAVQNNPNAEVSTEAKLVLLENKLENCDLDDASALPLLMTEVKAFFDTQSELTERHLDVASSTVRIINSFDDRILAADAYVEFGEKFAKSPDKQLAKYGQQLVSVGKSNALLVKPIELEGTLMDGTKLDWSKYRGKVVLIDFFATWCGPCREELPNLLAQYEAFHPQGFEIISISLDEDGAALKQFVTEQKITWPVMFNFDPDAIGWEHPMAVKFGVKGIPAMILVSPEGRVLKLNARGPALVRQLEKLFPATKPAAAPITPAAEKTPAAATGT